MKTNLRLLLSGIFFCGALISITESFAQVEYSEDFENYEYDWGDDFYDQDDLPCEGDYSLVTNIYGGFFSNLSDQAISPSLGISNGGVVTLEYDYKIVEYADTGTAVQNEDNWGTFSLYYGTSPSGPWTLFQTIDTSNHIESANCAAQTATFVPPAGSTTYVRLFAQLGSPSNDIFIYIDNVEFTQADAIDCTGAPDASAAVAASAFLCNGQETSLSLNPAYTDAGLSYQWQWSVDGIDYEDVADDGDGATLMTEQLATTWYRAVITCDGSGESTISEAVQIINTGLECPCEIEFTTVEPITLVQFAGIDNASNAGVDSSPSLEDFTALEPGEVVMGETYDITFEGNTNDPFGDGYETYFTVYIDFNQNGDFSDDGEAFPIGSIMFSDGEDGVQLEGEIIIPDDAMEGLTLMRVVKHYTYEDPTYPASLENPCGDENEGYGQAEDYLVNISAPAEPPVLDYYNLQWPATITINEGGFGTVYAQAWEPDVTPGAGAGEGVMAWIAVNDADTDPATWDTDVWVEAEYNASATANNDEFMLEIGSDLEPGTYYYAARWQLEDGPYTYGGFQGAWGDEGVVNGVLTVNCAIIQEPEVEMTTQTFCGEAEAHDLEAEETIEDGELIWYDAETGGNVLAEDDELQDGEIYYVAQMVDGCESVRVGITVEVNITPEVEAESPQIFETTDPDMPLLISLYDDVEVTAEGTVAWYATEEDAEDGENALDPETGGWVSDGTYYVTQTVDGCESEPTAVEIQTLLDSAGFASGSFTYYPNPVKDMLTLSYTEAITYVEVINMLGQKVLDAASGKNIAVIDFSSLPNGSYLLKVSAGEVSKTIKVIKQ